MILSKHYRSLGKAGLEAFVSQPMGNHLDSRPTNKEQTQGPMTDMIAAMVNVGLYGNGAIKNTVLENKDIRPLKKS